MQVWSGFIQMKNSVKSVSSAMTSLNKAQRFSKEPLLLLLAQSFQGFWGRGNHVFDGYRSITTDFSLLSGLDVGYSFFNIVRDVLRSKKDNILIGSVGVNVRI